MLSLLLKATHTHTVDILKINNALMWLKENNQLYKDVVIALLQAAQQEEDVNSDGVSDVQHLFLIPNDYIVPNSHNKNSKNNNQAFRLPFLTASPINVFEHPYTEEMAFPNLFPYGIKGYHCLKGIVTPKQYFTCRILNEDTRWASCIQHLF